MKKDSDDSRLLVSNAQLPVKTLTHFIKAGEASGHGCVFGGLSQIGCAGRPHFASLAERF